MADTKTNKPVVTDIEISNDVQKALATQKLHEYKQRYWLAEKEYLFYSQKHINEPELKKSTLDEMQKHQDRIDFWQGVLDSLEDNKTE